VTVTVNHKGVTGAVLSDKAYVEVLNNSFFLEFVQNSALKILVQSSSFCASSVQPDTRKKT
jgi:hypothetical protein